VNQHRRRIDDEGFVLCPLKWERGGINPFREAKALLALLSLYRRERPALVCHVALKPVLYGAWAARLASVPGVVNAVTGLGWAGSRDTRRAAFFHFAFLRLLKWTLGLSGSCATFQNEDDARDLSNARLREASRAVIIRGSGVDTTRFLPSREPADVPLVMLAARMLWAKGIGEFIAAIKLLKERGAQARFALAGMIDDENPSHIPESQLQEWQEQHLIEWWGYRDDMPQVLALAHVVVLPTYYGEGLPKVLLEAAACARPIVATKVRGCSEIVRDGDNGFLVSPRDPESLAQAIRLLIEDPQLRARMGTRSREIVVEEFSSERIVQEYLAVFRRVCESGKPVEAIPVGVPQTDGPTAERSMMA
jgi:glycosyltransferase involved in cell wall biosynthesis